jgi:hypothetical protein
MGLPALLVLWPEPPAGRSPRRIPPGLGDAQPLEDALRLARPTEDNHIGTLVGTSHIREDDPLALELVGTLEGPATGRRGPSEGAAGTELSVPHAVELTHQRLATLCLGTSKYVLVKRLLYASQAAGDSALDLQARV